MELNMSAASGSPTTRGTTVEFPTVARFPAAIAKK
jgi:hypothetical protein